MTNAERILNLLRDGLCRSDSDMSKALKIPEPSIRRDRLVLERQRKVIYAGARYEPTATVHTYRLP
jgi:hypothetical protein